jgi:hypothetical protein
MRSKLVGVILSVGILAGGTGAMAGTGTGAGNVFKKAGKHQVRSSPNSQYCPPKSRQPGKPKRPRPARCGKGPKPNKRPPCRMIVPDQVEPVIGPEQFAATEGGETAALCSPAIVGR